MESMSASPLIIGIAVGSTTLGLVAGYLVSVFLTSRKTKSAQSEADKIISKAEEKASEKIEALERKAKEELRENEAKAQEELRRINEKAERESSRARKETERRQRKLDSRNSALDNRLRSLETQEEELLGRKEDFEAARERTNRIEAEIETKRKEIVRRCSEISGLTVNEAKTLLLGNLESEVRQEAAGLVRRVEAETKEVAEKKARQLITLAVQRCAADQVTETTVSVVQLPSDDLKGRIIGREGRNIRALEAATGCNIIVDDTPEAVVLSCFDPIRREVARQTLERLIQDGRIHPGRIEEIVVKVEKELNDHIRQTGEQAVFELGMTDVHPELTKILGRLKYRTSYGQNILAHSVEVARLCSFMAAELGADPEVAKRAGLFHDLGKALTHEVEGTHAAIGADLCKKHRETPGVVHAVAAHHNEVEPRTIIAVLVQGADAISSARPGARRETLENYVKRLKSLEEIADRFHGVSKAYALQAGREVRIMVEPTEVNDNEAVMLARDISKEIEKEVEYPGQIKITVCREIRAVEYAK